ncbi:hypothetical protein MPSEU_000544500 [Mayamaea pseudoterrestris]|nr:hypothetical protein MPSEU_000544500 [Mayamaea pseudoterrestris]
MLHHAKLRYSSVIILLLSCCLIHVQFAVAEINESGLCALYTFVPFTNNGTSATSFLHRGGDASSNFGFDHMAAALLAMQHFNDRNSTVVPELANYSDCSVYFDLNNSKFFDSGTRNHQAAQALVAQEDQPCAIAGAYNDMPSLDLGAQATANQYAHVVYQAYNLRLSSAKFEPFTSQVYPSMNELASRTIDYLVEWNRTNFTAVLYPTTDLGIQQRELLALELLQRNMMYQTIGYLDADTIFSINDQPGNEELVAMQLVKDRGFRTIIIAVDDSLAEVPRLARAADQVGLNNGEYFYIFFGLMDPELLNTSDPQIVKLLYGSVWINAIELFLYRNFFNLTDPFAEALETADIDFIERLNDMNPISRGEAGYISAPPKIFHDRFRVEIGSGFMYDAVMSIGIGACLAQQESGLPLDGVAHQNGIRDSNFSGASGHVEFSKGNPFAAGIRNSTTVSWGALNLLPNEETNGDVDTSIEHFTVAAIMPAATDMENQWVPVANFTFADGRNVPPTLLRDMPDQNYLSPELRGLSIFLVATVYISSMFTVVWVFLHRSHRVVKAAQPMFLYILAFGTSVLGSTILCFINDESYGWSAEQLGKACISVPWLITWGLMIIYLALFSKLWRVQKVLQFSRREIKILDVLWPAVLLMSAALVVLTCWTVLDAPYWVRVELDPISGASIGRCQMNDMVPYVVPLALIMFIPTVLTGYMAWKTKDVDDAYTESWWIFILFCVQAEILVVGAPLVAILRNVSTNGKIMGYAILFWILPITALSLVMVPKYMAYWRAENNVTITPKIRGRHGGNVYVSGLGTAPSGHEFSSKGNNDSQQQSMVEGQDVSADVSGILASKSNIGFNDALLDSQGTAIASNTTTARATTSDTTIEASNGERLQNATNDAEDGASNV